jgi:hypothetical protein
MAMSLDTIKFMLFPYTVLPEKELRQLSLVLPGLSVLQVTSPPAAPDWLLQMVTAWPAITEKQQIETIGLCLKGYREFAAVHGDDSVLASLSLDRISKDFAESRFRIQTELKKNNAGEPGDAEIALLEAAVFLEMARDLDEKEMEVEAGLTRMDSLEGEFREILGISEDEALEDTMETLSPPLRAGNTGLSFMLPKRIQSWFRLLFNHMPAACPVLVTTSEPALAELFEHFRMPDDQGGKISEPTRIALGSIPTVDDLAVEDFLSLLSDPEASGILASYWQALQSVLHAPGVPSGPEALSQSIDTLQDYLRHFRGELGLSSDRVVSIELVFADKLAWNIIREQYRQTAGPAQPEDASLDDLMKVVVCSY